MSASNGQLLLLDIGAMAKALGISRRHLFNLTQDGTVPAVRLGARVMYDPQDVLAALKASSEAKE